jgi:large conductance mechanosensitive channel
MAFMQEFKQFAMRGNLVDTAVAFIMGAAFGKVVTSFIDGVVMPAVGMLVGNVDFNSLTFVLKAAVPEIKEGTQVIQSAAPEVSIKYGTFITNLIDFVVVAMVIFMVIKAMNAAKKKEAEAPAAPPEPSAQEKLLMEIRDSLKGR